MNQILTQPFGRTGHSSTRAVFGAVCLKSASQDEADHILDLLLNYGINHIDVAPSYGNSELRVGAWMKRYRQQFFLATKIDTIRYEDAREQFQRSLDRLQVDRVDLLQLHNLTDVARREQIMGPGGALEYLVEAREQGLTRFIGITGHGFLAPRMHYQSLERFDFDTVLLPYNYLLMQQSNYAADVNTLLSCCKERNIAVQAIKSIARGLWGNKNRTHRTWYEPLTDKEAISKAVHWIMGNEQIFLVTAGDMQELPKVLEAAACFKESQDDREMDAMVRSQNMTPLFSY
ncbi:MAG: aldo/keto reductase [Deltaproteobacteria bacterium]|nr:aldo/keto reductase [Deltaproteobacteria bacterium]MBW1960093.1 aldo/keto reductase [Deltaproteobacteria bacterium]MBW2153694.1 aldo/keto reductase [Deltaproteobacteria bacterium]